MLNQATLPAKDRAEVLAFQKKVGELYRLISATGRVHGQLMERVKYLKAAVRETPEASPEMLAQLHDIEQQLHSIRQELYGDRSLSRRQFETKPSISGRVGSIVYGLWSTTTEPTTTQRRDYDLAAEAFEPVLAQIKKLSEEMVPNLEQQLEKQGAPWTPGRKLYWNKD